MPPGELPRSIPVGSNVPTVPGASIPGKAALPVGKDIAEPRSSVPCDEAAAPQLPEERTGRSPATVFGAFVTA